MRQKDGIPGKTSRKEEEKKVEDCVAGDFVSHYTVDDDFGAGGQRVSEQD